MYFSHSFQILLLSNFVFSSALALDATTSAGNPLSTACGDIVNDPKLNDPDQDPVFNASVIYECLTSVPFNAAVANSFIQYINDTIQFQSTLEYLKNPPTSYQQPGIDLEGGLAHLQSGVFNGAFQNQYEFEAALQALLMAAHDSHLYLDSGILAAFSFGSPKDLVSISEDGVQTPKIYIATDVAYNYGQFTPSAITSINGQDVITYLENFAAQNSFGGLESHTDWNQLFFTAAEGIQDTANIFTGGVTFYPGDTITFTFENGSSITEPFLGVYYSQGPTGPLETGGDFFNFFVLGYYPDSYDPDLIDNNNFNISSPSVTSASNLAATATTVLSSAAAATSTSSTCPGLDSEFYPPCADIAQKDLAINGPGVTGYFLHDASIAVLSIPSFYTVSNISLANFDAAIAEFINSSQEAGMTKVVIDLQSNEGGEPLLAIDTFKHFFPNIDPYGGSRLRGTTPANVMGQTLTTVFQNLSSASGQYVQLVDSEWVATTKLDANTNQTFTSWPEFFGPSQSNGDFFTTVQRYNLSNTDFVEASFGDYDDTLTIYGYGSEQASSAKPPPFEAQNIIILSDGVCASACALFMEMMHNEAGVRVVAAGGRPTTGPMQAPGGTRGAILYDTGNLDSSISTVQTILQQNDSPEQDFLPDRTDTGDVYVTYASVNLRDQVRKGETTPLQFAYEAADCRIFYTAQTIFNYTLLWKYAADAIWTNASLCVANSTGFATTPGSPSNFVTGPNSTISKPQILTMGEIASSLSLTNTSLLDLDTDTTLYDLLSSTLFPPPTSCTSDDDCNDVCVSQGNCRLRLCAETTTCGITSRQCLTACTALSTNCGSKGATCQQLPVFATESGSGSNQLVCPWKDCSSTTTNNKKRTIAANRGPASSRRTTSGTTKRP